MCCAPKPVGRLPMILRRVSGRTRDKNAQHQAKLEGTNDARTGMPFGIPKGAMCVQRFDDSLNSAIHTTYRISLRSSSMPEPRDPLLKVLIQLLIRSDCNVDYKKRLKGGPSTGEPAEETKVYIITGVVNLGLPPGWIRHEHTRVLAQLEQFFMRGRQQYHLFALIFFS